MIKYAVFDWDGTIAETYPVIVSAYQYVFEKLNMQAPSEREIKEAIGRVQNKDMFLHFFDSSKISMAKKLYYEYIEKFHTQNLKPMKGAKELLDFCLANHIKPLLMTNKRTKYINEELKILGFERYFSKVVAAGEFEQDKPHRIACNALFDGQVPPASEIVVIGDGKADVEVAKCYGASSIIYQDMAKGDYNISDLTDAIEIIKGKKNAK